MINVFRMLVGRQRTEMALSVNLFASHSFITLMSKHAFAVLLSSLISIQTMRILGLDGY